MKFVSPYRRTNESGWRSRAYQAVKWIVPSFGLTFAMPRDSKAETSKTNIPFWSMSLRAPEKDIGAVCVPFYSRWTITEVKLLRGRKTIDPAREQRAGRQYAPAPKTQTFARISTRHADPSFFSLLICSSDHRRTIVYHRIFQQHVSARIKEGPLGLSVFLQNFGWRLEEIRTHGL